MSKTLAEQMNEVNVAIDDAHRVFIQEFAASRVGRFLGRFYEWERVRIGNRLAKVATFILAANLLWLWPVAVIAAVLDLLGFGT